jgi:alkanesulfonate monooxygenase SsuD/methylene tetrahydromethanopterin reductase-like flavin-dependent oxidoreductase (luciferase family)
MKFGVRLPNSGPFAVKSSFARIAKECARLDYDAVWVHDHMHWGIEDATHFAAGSAEAVRPGTYQNFFESISTLAHLSTIEKIRFGIAALVLPFRNPIATARQFGTLQELTGGRMILGVCPGGIEHEFERLHIPWKTRGGLTEEYMQVFNTLYSDELVSSFDGEYIKFSNLEFFPKPIKPIPMWYAGHPSTRTARRVAKYCDGWIPSYLTCPQFEKTIKKIRKFAVEFDRNPDKFDICHETYICIAKTGEEAEKISRRSMKEIFPDEQYEKVFLIGSPDDIIKKLKMYEKSGLTDFEIKFICHDVDQMLDMIELFANEVKPTFS